MKINKNFHHLIIKIGNYISNINSLTGNLDLELIFICNDLLLKSNLTRA